LVGEILEFKQLRGKLLKANDLLSEL